MKWIRLVEILLATVMTGLLVFGIIALAELVSPSFTVDRGPYDPILDGPFGQRGENEMAGWTVGFQWMGDKEEFRDDVVSGSFDVNVNAPGGFSFTLPLDEHALNLLGDTVVRVYYDGEPQFWGFVEHTDIDEAGDVVNVSGGDMPARMVLRKVDYQAVTAYGSNPPRGDQDSKTVFQKLIQWYTGETSSDSMFAKEFIERSETEYRYTYDGNSLHDALVDVAQSCSLTVGEEKHIGYGYWVEGNENILLQPYGWRKYNKEIPGFWKMSFDYTQVRNRIHLRGGQPDAWYHVEVQSGSARESHSFDDFEDNISSWDVTVNGYSCTQAGSTPAIETQNKAMGEVSAKLTGVSMTGGDYPTYYIYLTRNSFGPLDWGYEDEGGNTKTTISAIRIHMNVDGGTSTGGVHLKAYIGNDSSNYGRSTYINGHYAETHWQKYLIDTENADDWDEVGTPDWHAIDFLRLHIGNPLPGGYGWSGTIWLDGLAVFFKEVDVWRRDETSIQLHGLKEAKFQDRRITEWSTGENIAENILELLKYPSVNGSTTIPYYDPDLRLNMLVEPEIEGVRWPLYVNGLHVEWSGDHVSTSIKAGRPVPSDEDIEMAFQLLRDQDSEKGAQFQAASTYEQSTCFKDKELFCRTDCMTTNCQNAAQLLSCFTFAERNPCVTTCQKYKERTGWLNKILNQ